jgi:hypothetical protein
MRASVCNADSVRLILEGATDSTNTTESIAEAIHQSIMLALDAVGLLLQSKCGLAGTACFRIQSMPVAAATAAAVVMTQQGLHTPAAEARIGAAEEEVEAEDQRRRAEVRIGVAGEEAGQRGKGMGMGMGRAEPHLGLAGGKAEARIGPAEEEAKAEDQSGAEVRTEVEAGVEEETAEHKTRMIEQ